ncbi:MAG: hypothetical protein O2955_13970 [Planctomycetota bacterium]|nr:hypothetical protein [Planctomycetota bacterium]MDA1213618.1 hypothetical protein [Planctomycetota bacterium]
MTYHPQTFSRFFTFLFIGMMTIAPVGCGSSPPPTESSGQSTVEKNDVDDARPETEASSSETGPKKRTFRPVQLGDSSAHEHDHDGHDAESHRNMEDVMTALKPLQVVLGNWNGITKNKVNDFNGMEAVDWVWDLKTDPHQPALVFHSPMGNYVKTARMTYLADRDTFQLTTTDVNDEEKIYEGGFTKEVEDVPGDDKKLQRTFELTFEQISPPEVKKLGRVKLRQIDNNRYQMELADRRGKNWHVADIVACQREGTSFALSDTDYGDKTCIISQGLGTIAVNYEGKTFYVCCSGCKAAFEEDPQKWIARMEERKMK